MSTKEEVLKINVSELVDAGYSKEQAVEIALKTASKKITSDEDTVSRRFYTSEMLSEHMAETPEGFLICYDVPITRTGQFIYKSNEVPSVEGGYDGLVKIERDDEEVFSEETIKSFEGKPVTINHPDDFVSPNNWKELAHGTVQNVRRGDGEKSDLLLADLCLASSDSINLVRSGLRQVSCGYDAQYERLGPGKGRQKEILGNHVALVVKGRAGERCAIMDSENNTKEVYTEMANRSMREVLRKMFPRLNLDHVKDEDLTLGEEEPQSGGGDLEEIKEVAIEAKEAAEKAVQAAQEAADIVANAKAGTREGEPPPEPEEESTDDDPAGGQGDLEARISSLEEKIQMLIDVLNEEDTPAEEEEKIQDDELEEEVAGELEKGDWEEDPDKVKVGDSIWQDAVSRADILSPGIFIKKPKAGEIGRVLQSMKRQALSSAMTKDAAPIIKPMLKGKKISDLTKDSLDTVFYAASEMVKRVNDSKLQKGSMQMKDLSSHSELAAINKRNKEFWGKNKK
jgi:hypothetical protein